MPPDGNAPGRRTRNQVASPGPGKVALHGAAALHGAFAGVVGSEAGRQGFGSVAYSMTTDGSLLVSGTVSDGVQLLPRVVSGFST